jgi:hypothetical protein
MSTSGSFADLLLQAIDLEAEICVFGRILVERKILRSSFMASTARPQIRVIRSPKAPKAPISREQEILKEFESFFDRHIGTMSPSQLQKFEARSAEIVEVSRNARNESVSVRGKAQSSLKVRSR